MRKIIAVSIPHIRQTYETVGNYADIHGTTLFTISDMDNEWYERLVFLHEFLEETLCRARGVSFESIDAFDKAFEAARQSGDVREPGDQPEAPYHKEHVFATGLERLVAAELGVNWDDYDRCVLRLSREKST